MNLVRKMRFNIDYDEKSDDLFLYNDRDSKGSIEMGDLILDFDSDGNLTPIELLNATTFLRDSVSDKEEKLVTGDFLLTLIGAEVFTKQQSNFLFIKIILTGKKDVISFPINAPLIGEASPALVYP